MSISLSIDETRRAALAAQGFADRRPTGRVDRRHLRRVIDRMGLIQIDAVNVLVRSEELPLFARLGPHPRSLIADATAAGELFEYWVHEACHVPTKHYHLHRWAMDGHPRWKRLRRFAAERADFVASVLERVRQEGPVVASDLKTRVGPKNDWWDWDDGKRALEHLFRTGEVAATRRATDFARVYDLAERAIPSEVLNRPAPDEREARKQLLELAAQHCGVGTASDLADYHRQSHTRTLIAELVEEGRLVPASVEGWKKPAYMHPEAKVPRRIDARALLSPFDPLVWCRPRVQRLFGFHYRIEIYTPAAQRQYGYYVLPVLVGDRLVGRVDLKADRQNSTLLVQSAWKEQGVEEAEVGQAVAVELRQMAGWLGLEKVEIAGRGDLALREVGGPVGSTRVGQTE